MAGSALEKKGKILSNGHSVSPHTFFSSVHSDDDYETTLDQILEGQEESIKETYGVWNEITDLKQLLD